MKYILLVVVVLLVAIIWWTVMLLPLLVNFNFKDHFKHFDRAIAELAEYCE